MRVVFRVDSSDVLGHGHIARCVVFANLLRSHGVTSHFICRAHPGNSAQTITNNQHNLIVLPIVKRRRLGSDGIDHVDSLGATVIEDADETSVVLKSIRPRWLIIDHFSVNAQWERRVRENCDANIMVIDGQADREHDCDILLDQTYSTKGMEKWAGLLPEHCQAYVGSKHAILRDEFYNVSHLHRERDGNISTLLVCYGGGDHQNLTGQTLEVLSDLAMEKCQIYVVLGQGYKNKDKLISKYASNKKIKFICNAKNMADLMVKADFAIGGGGVMALERCYTKLPSITVSFAPNQVGPSQELEKAGATLYLNGVEEEFSSKLSEAMSFVQSNPKAVKDMSFAAGAVMDGNSNKTIYRIIRRMINP